MGIETKLQDIGVVGKVNRSGADYQVRLDSSRGFRGYALFSEQYLEKPVISTEPTMDITPTACTIGGIPVIDDF